MVNIRRQPLEAELRLPLSKRQLIASVSCEALHLDTRLSTSAATSKIASEGPVKFFWTPDYWYRPRSAKDAYNELLVHLRKIRKYCHSKSTLNKKGGRRTLFKKVKFKKHDNDFSLTSTDLTEEFRQRKKSKQRCRVASLFRTTEDDSSSIGETRNSEETSLQFLRRILRLEIALTAWDFDSTTLAHQLTLIDRDLFLKIPPIELGVLLWQQTSKNSPNIGALEAFSHRVSCLVATEILRDDSERIRARLIARLVNTAEKCHQLCNFQSCRSILCGLQSPSIYRLRTTWNHVRKRHATKYEIFENLCRLYRDPRLPVFQKAFLEASQEPPYLPYIGDLIAQLLNRVSFNEDTRIIAKPCKNSRGSTSPNSTISEQTSSSKSAIKRLLSSLRTVSPPDNNRMRRHKKQHLIITDSVDSRIIRLNKAIEMLESSQKAAVSYNLGTNDLAQEYLLKARYREDKENFFNSFGVEPPVIVNDTYICNY